MKLSSKVEGAVGNMRTVEKAGILVMLPLFEPTPSIMWKIGKLAAFIYLRWSCWAIGVEVLHAAIAVYIGPVMFGVAHIKKQLDSFDRQALAIRQKGKP